LDDEFWAVSASLPPAKSALPAPALSEWALRLRDGLRKRESPATGSVNPSAKVQWLVSCGAADRGRASADGTAAFRFEARDNQPVALDTRSAYAAGTDNSDSLGSPGLAVSIIYISIFKILFFYVEFIII